MNNYNYQSILARLSGIFDLRRRSGKLSTCISVCCAISLIVTIIFNVLTTQRIAEQEAIAAAEEEAYQQLLAQAALSVQLSPIGKMGTIVVEEAFLRTEPDLDSESPVSVRAGESYKILSERSGWYLIKYSQEQSLYIYSDYICAEGLEPVLDPVPEPVGINDMPIGDQLYEICKEYGAVGCGVAIIKDGQVAYTYNYGYQNKALRSKVTPDTKFRCAQLSQLASAMAFMSLEGVGRISLEDEMFLTMGYSFINPYYPGEQITPLHLMTHTSGLRDEKLVYNGSWENASLQTLMGRRSCYYDYTPGKVYSYSTSGFGVLGAVVEKVTDLTFTNYTDLMFNNIGIDASYEGARINDLDTIADCYRSGDGLVYSKQKIIKSRTVVPPGEGYITANGGLIISAKDYAKLVTILLNDGMYAGQQVLTAAAAEKISTVWFENDEIKQGLAVQYKENMYDGHDLFFITGNSEGILSLICYDTEAKCGAVIISSGAISYQDEHGVYSLCADITELAFSTLIPHTTPADTASDQTSAATTNSAA